VPTARRLVMSSMTSRDSMMSYLWRHNIQSRRIRKLGPASTIRVDFLRSIIVEYCVKNQLIRVRTLGEEA